MNQNVRDHSLSVLKRERAKISNRIIRRGGFEDLNILQQRRYRTLWTENKRRSTKLKKNQKNETHSRHYTNSTNE